MTMGKQNQKLHQTQPYELLNNNLSMKKSLKIDFINLKCIFYTMSISQSYWHFSMNLRVFLKTLWIENSEHVHQIYISLRFR